LLRSIIISPNADLATRLESALSAVGEVTVVRKIDGYPPPADLTRIVRAQGPHLVFLSFAEPEKAIEIVRFLSIEAPGMQVIAMHSSLDSKIMRETMRAGVREFLAPPFEQDALLEALRNVRDLVERSQPFHHVTNDIFTFLPSKAGVGTTTLALNLSAAMAKASGAPVLLSDFDLNSGMLRFMLKLKNERCVLDAVEHASAMDEDLWPPLVSKIGKLEVLHAGKINPNLRIEPGQIRSLMQFMRRNYSTLCFDVSGNLERYSLEIMQESRRVLLVCTPEIPSLHLAREKLSFLKNLDLDGRVSVILNRVHKKPLLTKEQVENVVGVPVVESFGNDYTAVNNAMADGKVIAPDSDLGKQFARFAMVLLDKQKDAPKDAKRKFLEFFSVQYRSAVAPQK